MTSKPLSVIIVGAGIFGVTAALELRLRGYSVALFDPGPLPRPEASSTDISKIIRMDYGTDEFYTELMEVALPRWRIWNQQWQPPLYHQIGFLLVPREKMQPGSFEYESFILLKKRGHGFKFAPVLGEIIADVLEEKPNPFAGRFAWRSRGKKISEAARCTE